MTEVEGQPTILLVEDDEDTRASVAEVLEEEGYFVVSAVNGLEAIRYLRAHPPPDCMVMDLWMPVMDGWALVSEMKRGEIPEVPTVVITAAEPHWGYPAPARRVLRKPIDPNRLLSLVGHLLADEPSN